MTPIFKENENATRHSDFANALASASIANQDTGFDDPQIGPNTTLVNREFQLPDDAWYHLIPYGDYPNGVEVAKPDGTRETRRVIQRLDNIALKAIVANFEKDPAREVLIDFEHDSLDIAKPTRAGAWIEELKIRNDGVYAKLRLTTEGREAIEGGVYRGISPVFANFDIVSRDPLTVRPKTLFNAGLTNRPAIKTIKPLSNREQQLTTENHMDPRLLLIQLLGLQSTASDDDIQLAANRESDRIKTLEKNGQNAASLQEQVKELQSLLVNRDLEQYKAVIDESDKDSIKSLLVSNREGTVAMLEKLSKKSEESPFPGGTIANREDLEDPSGKKILSDAAKKAAADELRATRISNRAKELKTSLGIDLGAAYSKAEAEIQQEEKAASK